MNGRRINVTAASARDGWGPSLKTQSVDVTKGSGTFTLLYAMICNGWPHVSFYAGGQSAGGVYFGPDQGSLSFDTVIEQIQALATEKHPYRTVVIDSISKLFNIEIAAESERLGDKDAFGASKKPAVQF